VYRDIDDLFEDDAEDDGSADDADADSPVEIEPLAESGDATAEPESPPAAALGGDDADEDDDDDDEVMEAELESIFESLCEENRLVSKAVVRAWDEVSKLLADGLLGEDEFEDLWRKTSKSPGSDDQLDVDGFLSFNVALDGLFDFEDDDVDDGEVPADGDPDLSEGADPAPSSAPPAARTEPLVDGDGISAQELFRRLTDVAGANGLSREDVLRWSFLRGVIDDGDLTVSELESIFAKASKGKNALDEKNFVAFTEAIDDLFEDDDGEDGFDNPNYTDDRVADTRTDSESPLSPLLKQELLDALDDLNDPDLLPCGLDSNEFEQKEILNLVSDLEKEPSNMIRASGGEFDVKELDGSWDLLYSSSSAMRFNKGLSGLGGSFPNGRFGGLRQVLKSTKFVSDVEYVERIEVNPSAASFDVTVTGDWELRRSVSLFTGEPSLVMTIQPDRVTYGLTSMKADHWKSLGPMNMLDISYLDEEGLRIMRGNTAVDTIFIFRRSTQ
jgi:hypothetical protein